MPSDAAQGLLLIPQISGYAKFVGEVELAHSEHIIAELLEFLIDHNRLELLLSDLDGEALVFYGLGDPPSAQAVLEQADAWTSGFHTHLKLLQRDLYCPCGACQDVGELGLHILAHYGDFGVHSFRGRSAVIGKDVIFARQLMENSLTARDFLLLSAPLIERWGGSGAVAGAVPHEEEYPVFGKVSLTYRDLGGVRDAAAAPAPAEGFPSLPGSITAEVAIAAPLKSVAEFLIDIPHWPDWVDGLERIELNASVPLRSGRHHVCVMNGRRLHHTMQRITEGNDDFTMAMRIQPPVPFWSSAFMEFSVQVSGGGVNVRHTYGYRPKPLWGRLFDRMAVAKLRQNSERSLENLRGLVEAGARSAPAG